MKFSAILLFSFFFVTCSDDNNITDTATKLPISKIAIVGQINNQNGIFTVNSDGTGLRRVSFAETDSDPVWLPGKESLVYIRQTGSQRLLIKVDADGSNEVEMGTIDEGYVPVWSPNGFRLMFRSGGSLVSVNSLGTDLTVIADNSIATIPPEFLEYDWYPSPANQFIVSARFNNDEGPFRLYRRLTPPTAYRQVFRHETINPRHPKISPDGSHILFMDLDKNETLGDVYVTDIEGNDLKLINGTGRAFDPEWSPDGSLIAVREVEEVANVIPTDKIIVYDVSKNYSEHWRTFSLQVQSSREESVSWSPDSRSLLRFELYLDEGQLNPVPNFVLSAVDFFTREAIEVFSGPITIAGFSWSSKIR